MSYFNDFTFIKNIGGLVSNVLKFPNKRVITIELPLSQTAAKFDYEIEADSYDDVYHSGYSDTHIKNMNISLPKNLEGAEKLFAWQVGRALEDAERDAIAQEIVEDNLEALKNCLEKINLSNLSYFYEGKSVEASGGITAVEIDQENDIIRITIENPEHLINAMIDGVGAVYPDLNPDEPATTEQIKSRFYNLKDYFDIYGESKPRTSERLDGTRKFSNEYFEHLLVDNLENMELPEIVEAISEAVDSGEEKKKTLDLAIKLTKVDKKSLVIELEKKIDEDLKNLAAKKTGWE